MAIERKLMNTYLIHVFINNFLNSKMYTIIDFNKNDHVHFYAYFYFTLLYTLK